MNDTAPTGAGEWRPGYHAERTFQAWVRSSLSTLLAAGVTARLGVLAGLRWVEFVGLAVGVVTIGCILLRWRQVGRLGVDAVAEDRNPRDLGVALFAVVAAVAVLGSCGVVLAVSYLD